MFASDGKKPGLSGQGTNGDGEGDTRETTAGCLPKMWVVGDECEMLDSDQPIAK